MDYLIVPGDVFIGCWAALILFVLKWSSQVMDIQKSGHLRSDPNPDLLGGWVVVLHPSVWWRWGRSPGVTRLFPHSGRTVRKVLVGFYT